MYVLPWYACLRRRSNENGPISLLSRTRKHCAAEWCDAKAGFWDDAVRGSYAAAGGTAPTGWRTTPRSTPTLHQRPTIRSRWTGVQGASTSSFICCISAKVELHRACNSRLRRTCSCLGLRASTSSLRSPCSRRGIHPAVPDEPSPVVEYTAPAPAMRGLAPVVEYIAQHTDHPEALAAIVDMRGQLKYSCMGGNGFCSNGTCQSYRL